MTVLITVPSPQQLLSNSPSLSRTRSPVPRTSLRFVPLRSHTRYGRSMCLQMHSSALHSRAARHLEGWEWNKTMLGQRKGPYLHCTGVTTPGKMSIASSETCRQ